MRGLTYLMLWAIFHITQVYARRKFSYMTGRHVCARRIPESEKYPEEQSICVPKIQTFTRPCSEERGHIMCKGYRKIYTTVKRVVYRSKKSSRVVFSCCPGWSRKPFKKGCTIPVCSENCSNNGVCVAPGKCECGKSWKGELCEKEENKCLVNNGGCQHNCINDAGTVRCECRKGYDLMKDGKSCEVCLTCSQEWQVMNQRVQTLEQLTYTLTDKLLKVEQSVTSQAESSKKEQAATQPDVSNKDTNNRITEETNKLQEATLKVFSTLVEKVAYLEATMANCGCGKLDILGNIIAPHTNQNADVLPKEVI